MKTFFTDLIKEVIGCQLSENVETIGSTSNSNSTFRISCRYEMWREMLYRYDVWQHFL